MEIKFYCPHCQQPIEADSAFDGEEVNCPNCAQTIMVPHATIGAGTSVGGFLIKDKIGSGGMGDIYLAEQKSMGRDVALKILPPAMTRDKTFLYRFMQEIKLLGSLKHPNIVVAHDAGEDEGAYYLAMEYVRGENLAEILQSGEPFSEEDALRIVYAVSDALEYAWDKSQFIHRDIKPANIMLNQDNEVKVMDLGLAKSMNELSHDSMAGYIIGTPQYMPPEQLADEELDCRSDMYSLGATLYHMLTGDEPYKSSSLIEVLRKRANDPLPCPTTLNPMISDNCLHLLEALMARDIDHRPESWLTVKEDALRILHGEYPLSRRPEIEETMLLPGPKGRRLQRNKKTAGMLVKVAAGLVVIAAFARLSGNREPEQIPAPAAEPAPATVQQPKPVPVPQPNTQKVQIEELYSYAQELKKSQPKNLRAHIQAFEALRKDSRKHNYTKYSLIAERELGQLKKEKERQIEAAKQTLNQNLSTLVKQRKFSEAEQQLEAFSSPWKPEMTYVLQSARLRIAEERTAWEKSQQQAAMQADRRWRNLMDNAAHELLTRGSYSAMKTILTEGLANPVLKPVKGKCNELNKLLTAVEGLDQRVLRSFKNDTGKEITVSLKQGPLTAQIRRVEGRTLTVSRRLASGHAEQKIQLSDLAPKEWFVRLGPSTEGPVAFRKGLLALSVHQEKMAQKYFELLNNDLGKALVSQLLKNDVQFQAAERARQEQEARAMHEVKAREALTPLLQKMSLSIEDSPPEEDPKYTLQQLPMRPGQGLQQDARQFLEQFGESTVSEEWSTLLRYLANDAELRPDKGDRPGKRPRLEP